MVSWLEEIERREAAARAEISELRSRMEELAGRLAEREAVLSRLEITRETMTEILSGEGAVMVSVDDAAKEVPLPVDRSGAGSPVGVRLVPQWEPGVEADVRGPVPGKAACRPTHELRTPPFFLWQSSAVIGRPRGIRRRGDTQSNGQAGL